MREPAPSPLRPGAAPATTPIIAAWTRHSPPSIASPKFAPSRQHHGHLPLMESAGRAAADVARAMAGDRGGRVVVLAGPGNNGGDAFVVARWLRTWYFDIAVVFPGDAARFPPDARAAHAAFIDAGGTTVAGPAAERPALIVDGLFGIGLARPTDRRLRGARALGQRFRRAHPRARCSHRIERRHGVRQHAGDPRDPPRRRSSDSSPGC